MNVAVVPSNGVRSEMVSKSSFTRVGDDARVQQRIVGQFAVGLNPDLLTGLFTSQRTPRQFPDETLVDWVLAFEPLVDVAVLVLDAFDERSDRLGTRMLGIGI